MCIDFLGRREISKPPKSGPKKSSSVLSIAEGRCTLPLPCMGRSRRKSVRTMEWLASVDKGSTKRRPALPLVMYSIPEAINKERQINVEKRRKILIPHIALEDPIGKLGKLGRLPFLFLRRHDDAVEDADAMGSSACTGVVLMHSSLFSSSRKAA